MTTFVYTGINKEHYSTLPSIVNSMRYIQLLHQEIFKYTFVSNEIVNKYSFQHFKSRTKRCKTAIDWNNSRKPIQYQDLRKILNSHEVIFTQNCGQTMHYTPNNIVYKIIK